MTEDFTEMKRYLKKKYGPHPKRINYNNYGQVRAVYTRLIKEEKQTKKERAMKGQIPGQLSIFDIYKEGAIYG